MTRSIIQQPDPRLIMLNPSQSLKAYPSKQKLVQHRGQVADADIEALRTAAFDDGQIVEIIAHVALNLFTNYVNIALDVPIDFPRVKFCGAA